MTVENTLLAIGVVVIITIPLLAQDILRNTRDDGVRRKRPSEQCGRTAIDGHTGGH